MIKESDSWADCTKFALHVEFGGAMVDVLPPRVSSTEKCYGFSSFSLLELSCGLIVA